MNEIEATYSSKIPIPMSRGIHRIPMEHYLALDALSSSLCHCLLTRSPAHALYARQHRHTTSAMDVGTAAHQIFLEGAEANIVVIEAEDWRTKAAREARELARFDGKTPILASMMAEIRTMVQVAHDFVETTELAMVFTHGVPEQTFLWQEGKVWCKARPDYLSERDKTIVHFKTTARSANPDGFALHMADMGYDIAAALYARGLAAVSPIREYEVRTVFLVQESEAPYACSLVGLAPGLMEFGILKMERAIDVWTRCLASGHWPAYPTEICYAEPRGWQITQMAEKALSWGDQDAYDRIVELSGGVG